jgi:hypothetical protein
MSCNRNEEQNHNIMTANGSSENVAKFTCVGVILTNLICVHETIKEEIKFRECLFPLSSKILCPRLI